jgi:hypothetical protein
MFGSRHEEMLGEMRGEARQMLRARDKHVSPYKGVWVVSGIFGHVLLFAIVYFSRTYWIRYNHRMFSVIICPLFAGLFCIFQTFKAKLKFNHRLSSRGAIMTAVSCWLALIGGSLGGDCNYWWYMRTYYDFQDLAMYMNIDPLSDKGQSFMDAGQIYFKESTFVATTKAVAYVNNGIYCAAPIIRQPIENQENNKDVLGALAVPPSGTFDFWAIGKDCCGMGGDQFKCGAVGDPKARAGLRMLRDDIRPFYMLAVQEWTAGLHLPAKHPLFFHWVADPLISVDNYKLGADSQFALHTLTFLIVDVFIVLILLNVMFKIGVP